MKVKSFFEDGFVWSKVEEEKCCTICESAKAKGEVELIVTGKHHNGATAHAKYHIIKVSIVIIIETLF